MAVYVGTTKRISALFRNSLQVGTNPTSVTLRVLRPDETFITPNPTPASDGSGAYHYDLTYTQAGKWEWGFDGDGTVDVSNQGEQYVTRSRVLG